MNPAAPTTCRTRRTVRSRARRDRANPPRENRRDGHARPRAGAGRQIAVRRPPASARRPSGLAKPTHTSCRDSNSHDSFPRGDIACLPSHVRALAAATAPSALIGAWLYNQVSPTAAADLGAVLTRTSAAESLKLKVTQDGKTGEVWVRGRKLRRNLPDGTYQIARDGKAWLVDEKANRASRATSSLVPRRDRRVDLLALLDLPAGSPGDKQKELLAARPAEHATRDGHAVEIYRWETAAAEGTLRIEAVVDAKTQLLQSIESLRVRGERTEPICKLAVIARDKPVDEDLFVVGDTLTEDGRIGKVTDVQGLVAIRPVMHERCSPVTERMPLRPGRLAPDRSPRGQRRLGPPGPADRTGDRAGQHGRTCLRPSSFASPRAKSRSRPTARSPVELVGPGRQEDRGRRARRSIGPTGRSWSSWTSRPAGSSATRARWPAIRSARCWRRSTAATCRSPSAITRSRSISATRSRGPRSKNRSSTTPTRRLEGTFFFPLPQDASIAGFGMWIGDKLVEADVVEKERAREIYETILRERRDPGLLEWSGGNIFKARVFPIPAAMRKSGSRSPTRRSCRCAATVTATNTPCKAICSSSIRCGSLRST